MLWRHWANRILLVIFLVFCCLNKHHVVRTTNHIRFYSSAFSESFTKCLANPPDNNFPWPLLPQILYWVVAIVLTILYIFAIRHLLLQFSTRHHPLLDYYFNSLLRQVNHIKSRCDCVSRFSRWMIYRHIRFVFILFRLNMISFIWCHLTGGWISRKYSDMREPRPLTCSFHFSQEHFIIYIIILYFKNNKWTTIVISNSPSDVICNKETK